MALEGVNLKCLKVLIQHEIGELRRIKKELKLNEHISYVENFSVSIAELLFFNPGYSQIILENLRSSDVVFFEDNFMVIFFPGTDKEGAIHILEGLKEFFGEEGKYVVSTYPEDGDSYESLIESIKLFAREKGIEIINQISL